MNDNEVREVLTRPIGSYERVYLDKRDPEEIIELPAVANCFYLLTKYVDEIASGTSLAKIAAKDNPNKTTTQTLLNHIQPDTKKSNKE